MNEVTVKVSLSVVIASEMCSSGKKKKTCRLTERELPSFATVFFCLFVCFFFVVVVPKQN